MAAVVASWLFVLWSVTAWGWWRTRRRRPRGYVTPPASTLTNRTIGTNTAAPTAAGFSSTVTLGGQLAEQAWPATLPEPNRPPAPTGYGSFEGGNRGNGLLPSVGCDD